MSKSLFVSVIFSIGCAIEIDPCWFVGFRFVKVRSECVESVCSEIVRNMELNMLLPSAYSTGGGIPVSCEQAKGIMQVYHSADTDSTDGRGTESPLDPEDIISGLSDFIVPAFK